MDYPSGMHPWDVPVARVISARPRFIGFVAQPEPCPCQPSGMVRVRVGNQNLHRVTRDADGYWYKLVPCPTCTREERP